MKQHSTLHFRPNLLSFSFKSPENAFLSLKHDTIFRQILFSFLSYLINNSDIKAFLIQIEVQAILFSLKLSLFFTGTNL